MSSFVRNRLINDVYLPLIGENLAKQIGTAGSDTRTDRSGLLLLVSPPGYGKTTIMEYVANRLGLTFMKINGPALGHAVVSLDPTEAPNLSAREEVEKLNLALEMGDNVMIYVDDIQHTNPEFLQRFISLCDAQRKMEGVWRGKARTYDLRGKKVAVVMAGNPYTEGGTQFKIPDMLANRADTYNLGDILGGHIDAFKASYIENCLTSNPILSRAGQPPPGGCLRRHAHRRDRQPRRCGIQGQPRAGGNRGNGRRDQAPVRSALHDFPGEPGIHPQRGAGGCLPHRARRSSSRAPIGTWAASPPRCCRS